ncbi:hypothetical protein M405DRAFT_17150 [Rhizopogon salebrosus TDB-379]|nr:hypothetical protein M405DRAFT_17150 [Rhizopogon salebrosus TDB-379]
MVAAPEYSLAVQAKLVPALCVLHNFIHIHETDQEIQITQQRKDDFGCSITPAEREQAARKQDDIAKAMWAQYIEYTTNQN